MIRIDKDWSIVSASFDYLVHNNCKNDVRWGGVAGSCDWIAHGGGNRPPTCYSCNAPVPDDVIKKLKFILQ